MFYMLLQLPLGIIYFTLSVVFGVTSGAMIAGGIHQLATGQDHIVISSEPAIDAFLNTPPGLALLVIAGLLGVLLTLHLARALGIVHGKVAEVLLVRA
jgi:membrane protein insertase Oxa1/YidC/SpoIIIJ